MPCDELPDNLKSLWKEAGANPSMFTLDQLRNETNRLQAKRRKGQIVLAGSMLLMVIAYGLSLLIFPNLLARVGATLTAAACGYWMIHALIERARQPLDPGETGGVRFYRAELTHARDNCRWMSWRWALLLVPFILFDVGVAEIYSKMWPLIVWFVCFDCALLLAAFAIWAPLKSARMARKYQDCIDALDASSGSGQGHLQQ